MSFTSMLHTLYRGGGGKTKVTKVAFGESPGCPSFSPNGKRIVYEGSDGNIYSIGVGGGNRVKVTKGYSPSFSAGGKRIAYEGYAGNNSEIFTIGAGGGRRVKVTHDDTLNF